MIIKQLTPHLKDGFCQCPNEIIRGTLSAIAKVTLLILLSHQTGYELSQAQLLKEAGCGKEALGKALNEIESAGYLHRHQLRDGQRLGKYTWSITAIPEAMNQNQHTDSQHPDSQHPDSQHPDSQDPGFQDPGFQDPEKPTPGPYILENQEEEDHSEKIKSKNISFPDPERAHANLYVLKKPSPEPEKEPEREIFDEIGERRNQKLAKVGIVVKPKTNQQGDPGESDRPKSPAGGPAPKIEQDPDLETWLAWKWQREFGGDYNSNLAKVQAHLAKPDRLAQRQAEFEPIREKWLREEIKMSYSLLTNDCNPHQSRVDLLARHGKLPAPKPPEPPAQFISQEEQDLLRARIFSFVRS